MSAFSDAVEAVWITSGYCRPPESWAPGEEAAAARAIVALALEGDLIDQELADAVNYGDVEDFDGAIYPEAIQVALRQQAEYLKESCGFCGGSGEIHRGVLPDPCPRCGFLHAEEANHGS